MSAAGGSPGVMSLFSRLRARRSLDSVTAEGLLAGRGVPGNSPPGQHALARVLEIAAGPGSEEELAGDVAAAAAFVQVTSQVRSRHLTRRALAAAACAMAVGGAIAYGARPPATHRMAPLQSGISHHAVLAPPVTGTPARPPGPRRAGHQTARPAAHPSPPLHRGGG
jgi:hypothetical protein